MGLLAVSSGAVESWRQAVMQRLSNEGLIRGLTEQVSKKTKPHSLTF
jgi:hypothetical protein